MSLVKDFYSTFGMKIAQKFNLLKERYKKKFFPQMSPKKSLFKCIKKIGWVWYKVVQYACKTESYMHIIKRYLNHVVNPLDTTTQALYRFEWAFHVHISFYLTNDIQPSQGQIMLYIHIKKKNLHGKRNPLTAIFQKPMLGQLN